MVLHRMLDHGKFFPMFAISSMVASCSNLCHELSHIHLLLFALLMHDPLSLILVFLLLDALIIIVNYLCHCSCCLVWYESWRYPTTYYYYFFFLSLKWAVTNIFMWISCRFYFVFFYFLCYILFRCCEMQYFQM